LGGSIPDFAEVVNVGDFVDVLWDIDTTAGSVVKLRFYALPLTQ
jgi:hypothetical protein